MIRNRIIIAGNNLDAQKSNIMRCIALTAVLLARTLPLAAQGAAPEARLANRAPGVPVAE